MTIKNFKEKAMPIEIVKDHLSEKLDELADLAEYWKKWRCRGGNPHGIRRAMIMLSTEVSSLYTMECFKDRFNREGSVTGRISSNDVPFPSAEPKE